MKIRRKFQETKQKIFSKIVKNENEKKKLQNEARKLSEEEAMKRKNINKNIL